MGEWVRKRRQNERRKCRRVREKEARIGCREKKRGR